MNIIEAYFNKDKSKTEESKKVLQEHQDKFTKNDNDLIDCMEQYIKDMLENNTK
jgi:hypothetical protein